MKETHETAQKEGTSIWDDFTNQYSLSKTLRFELKPVGKTKDLVRTLFESEEDFSKSIQNDLELSESYERVKKLIDCEHRSIIDDVLSKFSFNDEELELLNKTENLSKNSSEEDDETEEKKDPFTKLRAKLSGKLNDKAKEMFESALLNKSKKNGGKCKLETWMENATEEDLKIGNNTQIDKIVIKKDLEKLQRFFTYFTDFNKNRKNVYSKEKITVSIPYRIIHDNFPIFKRNLENYKKIEKDHPKLKTLIDEKGANEIFKLEHFNRCLTQDGIDAYNNEKLGIIAIAQGIEQKKGINQIINEFVQEENRKIKKQCQSGEKPAKIKIDTFDKLKKQILSIKKTKSFSFTILEKTRDVIEGINHSLTILDKKENGDSLFEQIKIFLQRIEEYEVAEIYINEKTISILSAKIFGYGRYIEHALEIWCDEELKIGGNKKKKFLDSKQFCIKDLEDSLKYYLDKYEQDETLKEKSEHPILNYFKNPTTTYEFEKNGELKKEERHTYNEFDKRREEIVHILSGNYSKDLREEKGAGSDSDKIKSFLDLLLEFNYILSPFYVKDKNLDKDSEFYNTLKQLQEFLFEAEIIEIYNQARNYITKKPYSLDKFRLLFDTGTLLEGWDKNKEKQNKGILLSQEDSYYLVIMNKENNWIFDSENLDTDKLSIKLEETRSKITEKKKELETKKRETKTYEKIKNEVVQLTNNEKDLVEDIKLLNDKTKLYSKCDYKFFKDCATMIPKCTTQTNKIKNYFSKKSKNYLVKKGESLSNGGEVFAEEFIISKEIYDLNNTVFDKRTNSFHKKKSDGTKPKKFQKKYLKESNDLKGYEEAVKKWVAYCKLFLKSYESVVQSNYDLEDIFKKEYEHIDDFYRETNSRLYKITFEKELSEAWLYKQVANEKIYLFEIHNKDFNPKSIGKKNLHTLYWEMLFDKKNLADVVFKLNGEAKVFYRKASIHKEKRILHPVGCQVAKKFFRLEDGNFEPVPSESIDRLNRYYLSKFEKKEDKDVLLEEDKKYLNNFTIVKKYDVDEEGKWEDFSEEKKKNCARIKDKRFTKDKILFHCPIEINFKSKNTEFINTKVLEFLHKRDDVNIIGLDRGERNLIYLSMINTNGEIVEGMQFSLNKLSSVEEEKRKEIDYHKLLSSKEEERLKARKNWETIENIKNLKEGYLSQVVHQLAKLVIEKNAIIVLENLNSYIKEKRGAKVEKSIYQKFENMLIKKFQYLVLNKNNLYGKGGVLKGYQLTNKTIPPFKYMSKQEGFLFFVPPDYTSKICPSTGFINLLNTKFTSKENAIKFFEKINLSYDKEYEYFRFDFDYKMFDSLRVDVNELKQTKWSVCSHSAPRSTVVKENNKWFYKKKDINAELKKLFKENNIDFEKDNLDLVLQDKNSKLGAKFYESLLKQFSVLLALRHTWEDEEGKHDAIVSSVEVGERGSNKFFNSEEKKKKGKNKEGGWIGKLPVDADANGAYNIALKGLWLLNELNSEDDKEKAVKKFNELKKAKFIKEKKKNGEEKKKYVRRWCSNTDWLKFVHERNSK